MTRLSIVALDLAAAFTDVAVPPDVLPLLAQVDQSGVVVHGYRIVHSADGRIVQLQFPPGPEREVALTVPGVSVVELVAALGADAGLEVAEPGPFTRYAEVRGLRLAVRFDPALLRPLDGAARAELTWTGALRWHRDWRVELVGDPELSLSPCEIAGTGIVVELSGLQLDLATDRSPAAVLALGLDAGFQGVYARSGTLAMLPQARFGGRDGLRVDVRDLAVGTGGVTGQVGRYFALERTPDGGLDQHNALTGSLFDGAWEIGIGTVEVELRANAVERFLVDGLIRMPLLDPVLDVRFGMARAGAGYATTLHVGSATPLTIAVTGGQVTVGSFAFDGTFDGTAELEVSGLVADLAVALGDVRVGAGEIGAALIHRRDGDELRFALRDVPLGPLGRLDTADLVLTQSDAGRSVRFAASVAWDDLRGRLDLPPGVPEPAGGHVDVVVSWEDNGHVAVGLSAVIDDLGSLLEAVPAEYRPQVEEAALDVAIDYPSAVAFAAEPATARLTGSAAIAVTVALPMLAILPGVLDVRAGNADGLVRARLGVLVGAGAPQAEFALADPVAMDLTLPGAATAITLDLTSLTLAPSTFAIAGGVSIPALDDYLAAVTDQLGLPATLGAVLGPLGDAFAGESTFALSVEFDGPTATPSIDVVSRPTAPPMFALLAALGAVVDPDATPAQDVTTLPGLAVPVDFFAVAPGELRLSATFANKPSIRVSATLDTTVFGETFDTAASIGLDEGEFFVDFTAGAVDPILLTLPVPGALLADVDVAAVADAYGLSGGARAELVRIEQTITDLAAELGPQGVFTFEISNLRLGVTVAGPVAEGQARLVQVPRFLELLTPLSELRVRLGATVDKVFLAVDRVGGNADEPLLTVPMPGADPDAHVDVSFTAFRLAYAWERNELAFGLDAAVESSPTLSLTAGGSGVLVPAVDADVQLGATVSVPPAPIPEGVLSFRGSGDGAVGGLGLQAVIGAGPQRFVTAYLRDLAFSPTYFLLWPGFRGDGGLVLGGPNPRDLRNAAAFFDVRDWDRDAFFARFTVQNGSLIFFDAFVGLLLNPLAAVPPFLTANPPYWLAPPFIMGDLYADEIGVSVNLPGLAFLDLTFERPLPSFSLQALLELAALAAGGFTHRIPATSPLRKVFFARVRVFLELQLGGTGAALRPDPFEINVADFVNGAIDLMQRATATLDAGSDLLDDLTRDPAALVRMLPRASRQVAYAIEVGGFAFSGSLYLLTPDELRAELVLFFENRRPRPRGIAANQPPPDPSSTTRPVNQGAVLVGTKPITWTGIIDVRSLPPDVAKVAARSLAEVRDAIGSRESKIATLRNRDTTVDVITDALLALSDRTAAARKALLIRLGMPELVGPVAAAFAGDRRTREQRLRAAVAEAVAQRNDALVADSGLVAPPEELAAKLVGRIIPGGGILGGLDRRREIDALVPRDRFERTHGAVVDAFDVLERELGTAQGPDRDRAVAAVRRRVTDVLTEQFAVRRGRFEELVGPRIDPSALHSSIVEKAVGTWGTRPRVTDRAREVGVFDGVHFAGVLRGVDLFDPRPPIPPDVVEKVVGYQIRPRSGGGFAVSVPTATAQYTVVRDGDRYRLRVRAKDRSFALHDLPAALVETVPDGPRRAELLRDALIVVPRTVRLPRTADEATAVAEQFDEADNLYQTSVFARSEYAVKPEGGVHGPFTVADLLRDPATGDYTVPDGPTLLGGFKARLFGSKLQFGGIVTGTTPKTSAFLYGHHVLTADVGGFRVRAEGDFVAGTGSLWKTIPAPSGNLHATNAVGFSGHVVVEHGGEKVIEGNAEGTFTSSESGATSARLTVDVAAEGSLDIGVGQTSFLRVGWSLDGHLVVHLGQELTVETKATATVTVDRAVYRTTWVLVEPAQRWCVFGFIVDSLDPFAGHWGWVCTTTPEVRRPEIDFSDPDWESMGTAMQCALTASVSGDGITFKLDLEPFGPAVQDLLGSPTLTLPGLF